MRVMKDDSYKANCRVTPRDVGIVTALVAWAGNDQEALLRAVRALWPSLELRWSNTCVQLLLEGNSVGPSIFVDLTAETKEPYNTMAMPLGLIGASTATLAEHYNELAQHKRVGDAYLDWYCSESKIPTEVVSRLSGEHRAFSRVEIDTAVRAILREGIAVVTRDMHQTMYQLRERPIEPDASLPAGPWQEQYDRERRVPIYLAYIHTLGTPPSFQALADGHEFSSLRNKWEIEELEKEQGALSKHKKHFFSKPEVMVKRTVLTVMAWGGEDDHPIEVICAVDGPVTSEMGDAINAGAIKYAIDSGLIPRKRP